jgi:hypothetical protein
MVNVKTPASPVQKRGLWPPKNSRPYRVKDDDDWWKIANRERLDVWDLIKFNFATHVSEEVNWYLHELVGCWFSKDGGRNYAFRGADPNKRTIYLPAVPVVTPPPKPTWQEKLAKLKYEIDHTNDPLRDRLLCILDTLEQGGDDRVIFWNGISPGPDTPVPLGVKASFRSLADAEWLFNTIKTRADVANLLPLGDGTNPRRFVVSLKKYLFDTRDGAAWALRSANAAIVDTHVMLDRWANFALGGSSSMPVEYRAIQDFVVDMEGDSGSAMSCVTRSGTP